MLSTDTDTSNSMFGTFSDKCSRCLKVIISDFMTNIVCLFVKNSVVMTYVFYDFCRPSMNNDFCPLSMPL